MMHERCFVSGTQLAADLNADFASFYNEKKYKELKELA